MHDGPEGHYHDIGDPVGGHDDIVVWTTVGIDVGSSTSQMAFSRITLARDDEHYVVTGREMLHQSEVVLTPYKRPEVIDGARLSAFVDREYAAAGIARADIDAGAVILTGLALSTANARAIGDATADDSGRFVSVAAGDLLEARLAANGAGVPEISTRHQGLVVHVDIGGGTTKLSAWNKGQLISLAAIDIGARLLTYDDQRRIVHIQPPCLKLADAMGLQISPGQVLEARAEQQLTAAMARHVLQHAGVLGDGIDDEKLLRTAPLLRGRVIGKVKVDAVVFSGGVSEYIYGRERRTFGDLGPSLGKAIRKGIDAAATELLPFSSGIRATVLGASQHSMQLSGSTVYVSDPQLLPLRNVPVVLSHLDLRGAELDGKKLERTLQEVIALRGVTGSRKLLAVSLSWRGSATYARLSQLSAALIAALTAQLEPDDPIVVIADGDVAGVLGACLDDELQGARGVVCLDSIHVHEFDHIDIGSYAGKTKALPVVVKSLLFATSLDKGSAHVGH